ncbi:MAG: hypothetical protein WC002_09150 [Candidatus Muiribacteriota bacterium]
MVNYMLIGLLISGIIYKPTRTMTIQIIELTFKLLLTLVKALINCIKAMKKDFVDAEIINEDEN